MITNIKILDFDISVIGLIYFLIIFAFFLLFIYFIVTFFLFKNKKNDENWTNIIKIKQETYFMQNIEYFEKEIMLVKKNYKI